MNLLRFKHLAAGVGSLLVLVVAACGGNTTSSGGSTPSATANLTVSSFDSSFAAMHALKGVASQGHGLVGVILPDTTSSTRYVNFDQPYLVKAFTEAGYPASDFKVSNAQGSDATQLADAQSDITQGAKVIVVDPLDSTVGAQIQQYAQSHGVPMISYDRATFQGNKTYYVSFDNVQVGKLIGQGFMDCVSKWNVASPQVFELSGGEDTDPNAVSFAQGYNSVIWGSNTTPLQAGMTNSKGWKLVAEKITPGWTNSTGATIFQQQFTANPSINATVEANDGLGNAVIQVLKSKGIGANKIPTTGQDATLQGMVNVLEGFQCGSVYKAIYLEAQDAVAIATYLRAGQTPPSGLVNSTTSPPSGVAGNSQPASLLAPKWVDTSNMASTVIKDQFVSASSLCAAVGAAVCQQHGIPTS